MNAVQVLFELWGHRLRTPDARQFVVALGRKVDIVQLAQIQQPISGKLAAVRRRVFHVQHDAPIVSANTQALSDFNFHC